MEEEILLSENEDVQFDVYDEDQTDKTIPVTKILKKRDGDKLYLANKGCHSLIGCIEKIGSTYFIQGYANPFDKESQAIDFLLYGIF